MTESVSDRRSAQSGEANNTSPDSDRRKPIRVELPIEVEKDLSMPSLDGDPAEIWSAFFQKHRPAPELVREWVFKLHEDRQHPQVIACLEAALTEGQTQPWMYEVLALSMEIESYPKESIERVVLSLTDFGQVEFPSMLYSAAYLRRFGRDSAALRMYRQASRLLPERHEPYLLGVKLAQTAGTPEDIEWAAVGILQNVWGRDFVTHHREAENMMRELIRQADLKGDTEASQRYQKGLQDAKIHDVEIRLEWNGPADLDLFVEEPGGAVCSFENSLTTSGGIHLHDGIGLDVGNAYESYLCPRAYAGTYRIRVLKDDGRLVGNRATLMIRLQKGHSEEVRLTRVLVFDGNEASVTIDVPKGRRTTPRIISFARPDGEAPVLSGLVKAIASLN